jgi:hypothetical protein
LYSVLLYVWYSLGYAIALRGAQLKNDIAKEQSLFQETIEAAEELASPSLSPSFKRSPDVEIGTAREKKIKITENDENSPMTILLVFKHLLLPKLVFVFAMK